jgi:tetratricopeptide (TPR) repeat protein
MTAVLALTCLLALPQDPTLFRVDRAADPPRVSADRNGVSPDHALQELGRSLGWSVRFETRQLQESLALHSLDLSFDDQNPRGVAHLLALAGGADVVFNDRTGAGGPTTELHVVSAADPGTESGRQRMRQWSARWYQSFLGEDMRVDPLVVQRSSQTRMHLGHLLLKQGDVEGARVVFKAVYDEDPSHAHVPLALLRLAQCLFDLQRFGEAEHWCRLLARKHPSLPETAQATVLLGRILLAGADRRAADECVGLLEASLLSLGSTPEATDILLVIGEAHRVRGRLDRAYEAMARFAETRTFRELSRQQWLDYHFLRGLASEAIGKHEEAMEALELFLGTGEGDPRRGEAFVVLGRAYLGLGKVLEARAAAIEARTWDPQLTPAMRQQSRILWAKTALRIGDEAHAFDELELEVRRPNSAAPDLMLFLCDSYLQAAKYQKAITTAELMLSIVEDSAAKDQARWRLLQAMHRQAETLGGLLRFASEAIPIAGAISDETLQRRAAELVGKAYEAAGDAERAADAYRGLLR